MGNIAKILVADDDPASRRFLQFNLERSGFDVVLAVDGKNALDILSGIQVDLVVADYMMPRMNGLELLDAVKSQGRDIPFVILTGHGSVDTTMEAVRLGAVEYLAKSSDPTEILRVASRALGLEAPPREQEAGVEAEKYSFDNLIGESPAMRNVFSMIHKAAGSAAKVLISGESGTGKELAARAIHHNGQHSDGPFVAVNCSAFSTGTLESELFGHVKGAFTDALRDNKGRFEMAHGGTLFMDEVGDIPPSIQVKLLRVLQEKQFERVGGSEVLTSDFRLIAATNRDLGALVREKRFREDLYYRVSVFNIHIPPLREHPEDIPLLIKHFLREYGRASNKDIQTLSMDAFNLMVRYPWPGNVRQLENAIESAVAMCSGPMIRLEDLPPELTAEARKIPGPRDRELLDGTLPEVVERVERNMIRSAMNDNDWVKARAAKALGVSERILSYKMKKYGIEKK
ncbi:MAG: sigma-54-dependent transcriptional regulator [Desulfatibacillaceae bacterium]